MSQHTDNAGENVAGEMAAPGRSHAVALVIVLALAIAFHALTGVALLAAAIVAAHAGWRSLSCGCWLLHSDPLRPRAWACFWFYAAAAAFKAFIWATTVMMSLGLVGKLVGRPPTDDEVATEGITILVAVALTVVLGVVGVVSALRGRVRVWVNPCVRERCNGDFRRLAMPGGFYGALNYAALVIALAIALPVLLTVCGTVFSLPMGGPRRVPLVLRTVLEMLLVCGTATGTIALCIALARRIAAATPGECWAPAAE